MMSQLNGTVLGVGEAMIGVSWIMDAFEKIETSRELIPSCVERLATVEKQLMEGLRQHDDEEEYNCYKQEYQRVWNHFSQTFRDNYHERDYTAYMGFMTRVVEACVDAITMDYGHLQVARISKAVVHGKNPKLCRAVAYLQASDPGFAARTQHLSPEDSAALLDETTNISSLPKSEPYIVRIACNRLGYEDQNHLDRRLRVHEERVLRTMLR